MTRETASVDYLKSRQMRRKNIQNKSFSNFAKKVFFPAAFNDFRFTFLTNLVTSQRILKVRFDRRNDETDFLPFNKFRPRISFAETEDDCCDKNEKTETASGN